MFNDYVRNIEFELTNMCNAGCTMCSRVGTYPGGLSEEVYNSGWKNISKNVHHHVIDSLIHEHVEAIDYGGNFGDPLIHPNIFELLEYTSQFNIYQEVQTNASLQTKKFWKNVAKLKNLRIWFHIDGLEDTNHLYRRFTNFKKIENNAKTFLDSGGNGSWVFIVFRHNEHQVEEAQDLAKKWGFDEFIIKKTARGLEKDSSKFAAKDIMTKNGIQKLGYHAPNNPKYRADSLDKKENLPIDCYSKKRGTYYVTCEEEVHPCCITGKHAYRIKHSNIERDNICNDIKFDVRINPVDNTFNNIVKNYNNLQTIFEENWKNKNYKICDKRCGTNITSQKQHISFKDNLGSKRFSGWAGPHNLRNY